MKRTLGLRNRRPGQRPGRSPVRLRLETLEDRTLLSVDVGIVQNGLGGVSVYPPDPIAASGYDYVIEAVNLTVGYYDKYTGNLLFSTSFSSFFGPLGDVRSLSDPVVAFDPLTGQFVVGLIDYSTSAHLGRLDFAVSNDASPFDGWTLQRYDMNDGYGAWDLPDYPKLGYNADAWVLSANMFPNDASYSHVDTLAIDKSTLTGYRYVVPGGTSHLSLMPAQVQDANPGDPMWFVESFQPSGSSIKVVQMDNVLSDSPVLTTYTVPVPAYSTPPAAAQQGGSPSISTIDDRIMSASMIGGQIVAAHNIGSGGVAQARWYHFDTTQGAPTLVDSGNIFQGSGVHTYFPGININYEGDIGLTFMESSTSEYMSMYVTGQSYLDSGSGQMQTPVEIFAGTSHSTVNRAGDYSGMSVDPSDGYTFWGANEYKGSSLWNTGLASFGVSPQSDVATQGKGLVRHLAALVTAPAAASASAASETPTTAGVQTAPVSETAAIADLVYAELPVSTPDAAATSLTPAVPVVDGNATTLADELNGSLDSASLA